MLTWCGSMNGMGHFHTCLVTLIFVALTFAFYIIFSLRVFHRPGSVIVEFELIFTNKVEEPLKLLKEVVKTGKLGNMTVETTEGKVQQL